MDCPSEPGMKDAGHWCVINVSNKVLATKEGFLLLRLFIGVGIWEDIYLRWYEMTTRRCLFLYCYHNLILLLFFGPHYHNLLLLLLSLPFLYLIDPKKFTFFLKKIRKSIIQRTNDLQALGLYCSPAKISFYRLSLPSPSPSLLVGVDDDMCCPLTPRGCWDTIIGLRLHAMFFFFFCWETKSVASLLAPPVIAMAPCRPLVLSGG